jgi:hypothetical protein
MDEIELCKLPCEIQNKIFESVSYEFWDLIYYNPETKEIRYFDYDSGVKLPNPWLKVIEK